MLILNVKTRNIDSATLHLEFKLFTRNLSIPTCSDSRGLLTKFPSASLNTIADG